VTIGVTPSGDTPTGPVKPDTVGHPAIFWPRGLPADLVVLPIIGTEGVMRSGGVVIGGAKTKLVGYRYTAGVNDATEPTRSGTYDPTDPIHIQWNTPLAGTGTYPVKLELNLSTTYDDGTVRTSSVTGSVDVTVIYSALGG
jgi:hypothetical protein